MERVVDLWSDHFFGLKTVKDDPNMSNIKDFPSDIYDTKMIVLRISDFG